MALTEKIPEQRSMAKAEDIAPLNLAEFVPKEVLPLEKSTDRSATHCEGSSGVTKTGHRGSLQNRPTINR